MIDIEAIAGKIVIDRSAFAHQLVQRLPHSDLGVVPGVQGVHAISDVPKTANHPRSECNIDH